jgi:hypothetical protein
MINGLPATSSALSPAPANDEKKNPAHLAGNSAVAPNRGGVPEERRILKSWREV